jgi:hypothetical protein
MGKSANELKQLENTPEFERIIQVPCHAHHHASQLPSVHDQVLFTAACPTAAWVHLSSFALASCGMHSNHLFSSNQRVQRQSTERRCDPQAAQFQQRTFKLKVAEEVYNQEARIKVSIRDTEPIDFVEESAVRLCPDLAQLLPRVGECHWQVERQTYGHGAASQRSVLDQERCRASCHLRHQVCSDTYAAVFYKCSYSVRRCCWTTSTNCSWGSPSCCRCRRRKRSPLAAARPAGAALVAATPQEAAGMGRLPAMRAVSTRAQVSNCAPHALRRTCNCVWDRSRIGIT